jgi:hypothetical protein
VTDVTKEYLFFTGYGFGLLGVVFAPSVSLAFIAVLLTAACIAGLAVQE